MDERTLLKNLNSLIQLDVDAAHCYDEAIQRIEDRGIATTLEAFRGDHQRHADDLSSLVSDLGGTPPKQSPDLKGLLLEGMTALRSATGTEGTLKAMEMNEKIAHREYERAQDWDVPANIKGVLELNWDDEKRHLEYIRSQLHVMA
jgi:uncharacterized protein (TIGR02284 family)